eukprot:1360085-Prymnesium_polylepis.1
MGTIRHPDRSRACLRLHGVGGWRRGRRSNRCVSFSASHISVRVTVSLSGATQRRDVRVRYLRLSRLRSSAVQSIMPRAMAAAHAGRGRPASRQPQTRGSRSGSGRGGVKGADLIGAKHWGSLPTP